MYSEDVVESPLGPLRIVASDAGLVAIWFPGQRPEPRASGTPGPGHPHVAAARAWLEAWFAGRPVDDPPLDPSGTPFQAEVWRALREIPYGETRTYAQIAARVGRPSAVRAVGAAIGRNPLAIVVPCHRVVGSDGSLTGYAGGLDRKRWMLAHERNHGGAQQSWVP